MGDTVSIPDDPNNSSSSRKPSPPPDKVPEKGVTKDGEQPEPPTLTAHPPTTAPLSKPKKSKRCPQCRKEGKKRKLTIVNRFSCNKCDTDYCADHISAHDCDFDHHEHHKDLITKNNPTIQFKKVDKI